MAVLTSLAYARTRVRRGRTGQRPRLVATITATTGGVFNLGHAWSNYGRTSQRLGGPYFAWGPYGTPPLEHDTLISATGTCTEARFAWNERRRILVVLNDNGTIVERASDDDALSFNSPIVTFASGTHPDISSDGSGYLLRAAYVAGALKVRQQAPGDIAIGAAFSAEDASSTPLALTDDSFRIIAAPSGAWHLHVRLGAGAATTLLHSHDEGQSWAITSGAVTGITSGLHPGMCVGASGEMFAYAHVAGKIHLTRRFSGDLAWSTPVVVKDAASADLLIEDQAFSMTVAYEGSRRLVLAAIIDGEAAPSEWASSDEGLSFARLIP